MNRCSCVNLWMVLLLLLMFISTSTLLPPLQKGKKKKKSNDEEVVGPVSGNEVTSDIFSGISFTNNH